MVYEIYKPRRRNKKEPHPTVSLSKTSIVLNKIARAKMNADLLELAYDSQNHCIRIRPGTEDNGLPLKKTKILARGFFDHFKINKTGKLAARYDEAENALYVQL